MCISILYYYINISGNVQMNKKYWKYLFNILHYGGLIVFILLVDGAFGTWGIVGGILWYTFFPAIVNIIRHWDLVKTLYMNAVYTTVGVITKWGWIKKRSKEKQKE